VRYAKRGRLRFTSHRDFSRAFERALVRARIPMAYSSGFNPHPRISYAGASPTGAASEAEYLEIGLAEVVEPDRLGADLDAALPEGLDVLEVVEARPGSLADRLEASRWQIDLDGIPVVVATAAAEAFLARDSVAVERMTKKGLRSFDSRAAVLGLTVASYDAGRVSGSRLDVVLRHTEPAVRPDDVLTALAQVGGLEPLGAPLMTRLVQGPYDEGSGAIGDPLNG
jgi:radical SAM-linked protein